MHIDSHQHFWRYSVEDYPWIGAGMERIARDFLPVDLAGVAQPHGVGGSVAVQARQSLAESRWLVELADADPFVRGVVGWVDLQDPEVVRQLEPLAAHPRFVGVRHVVQDEPDPRFLLGVGFVRGLRQLRRFDLTYDLLLYPEQLPAAVELVGMLPAQPFVLDHLAKPRITQGSTWDGFAGWRRDIEALAAHDNVSCKVSGMVTEAAWRGWKQADFIAVLDVVLEAFGPGRLMFGSDWPVCLVAADYAEVLGILREFFSQATDGEQAQIFGETAARFYGLTEE